MKKILKPIFVTALTVVLASWAFAINDDGGSGGGIKTDRTAEEMQYLHEDAFRAQQARRQAGVTSVTIDANKPFEKVSGYTYVEATMHGTVARDDGSLGEYSVPMILIYPNDGGNGVGVVDIPNTVFHSGTGFIPDPNGTLQLTRQVTDGFLFEQGYTYASVQWDKDVTDLFAGDAAAAKQNHLASGSIEQTTDAWHIIRDAAGFLRDPSTLEAGNDPQPVAVDTVLSSGYSQTGVLLQTFVLQGENEVNGEIAYDGHLIGTGGFSCAVAVNGETTDTVDVNPGWALGPCDADAVLPADGSKTIAIITEATAGFFGVPRFAEEPANWRQYELAGIAHTNPAITLPASVHRPAENRNPVVHVPVFRAAFDNLTRWVLQGTPPPPSRLLVGEIDPETGGFIAHVDEYGNALGGLRLPHMEQEVEGQAAGAPLGTYTGINPPFFEAFFEPPSLDAFTRMMTSIGGTFTPFSDEELRERYPDHETYVSRVTHAADYLLVRGYIFQADRDAYVREAKQTMGE